MIPLADVAFFDVVVFFHILAAVLAFGPTFAYVVFLGTAMSDGGRAVPTVGRAMLKWDSSIGAAASLVILGTGIYLACDRWDFGDFFVGWGILAILVILGVVHGVLLPMTRKAVAVAERDIAATPSGDVTFSAEFNELNKKLGQIGTALGLLIILTIYFMTAKPFL